MKVKYFDSDKGVEGLAVIPISKASAKQRAGRAGRNQPGKCIRLYTKEAYDNLSEFGIPEILRSDLMMLTLQLKGLKIKNLSRFDFMDSPSPELFEVCIRDLIRIGAIISEEDNSISEFGKHLLEFPLEPFSAFCLMNLRNESEQIQNDVISVVALMNSENIYSAQSIQSTQRKYLFQKFSVKNSDHLTKLKILYGYIKARNKREFCRVFGLSKRGLDNVILVRYQLLNILKRIISKEKSVGLYNKSSLKKRSYQGFNSKKSRIFSLKKNKKDLNIIEVLKETIVNEEFDGTKILNILASSFFKKIADLDRYSEYIIKVHIIFRIFS